MKLHFLEHSFSKGYQWWKYLFMILIIFIALNIGSLPIILYADINNAFTVDGFLDYSLLDINYTFILELSVYVVVFLNIILRIGGFEWIPYLTIDLFCNN